MASLSCHGYKGLGDKLAQQLTNVDSCHFTMIKIIENILPNKGKGMFFILKLTE